MRLPRWLGGGGGDEHRAGYTDLVTAAQEDFYAGTSASPSGAFEAAVSCWEQACRAAQPIPAVPQLSPSLLALVGRSFIKCGEIVLVVTVDSTGMIQLSPAGYHEVLGGPDPAAWVYHVTLNGPTGTRTMFVPAANVIHLMYSRDPKSPWRGRGPLHNAPSIGRLAANSDSRLADEAGGGVARPIAMPNDPTGDKYENIKTAIKNAKGRAVFVETLRHAHGGGAVQAPATDWIQSRIGPDMPMPFVDLRSSAAESVAAACSVPASLLMGKSDGTLARENWRRFILLSVSPLMAEAAHEFRAKLDLPALRFSFKDLWAADFAGRSKATKDLVAAGFSKEQAARMSGIEVEDGDS